MTKFHSDMTPQDIIAVRTGFLEAAAITIDLNRAGYIIVRKGAIGQAQREAVASYKEDAANDNKRIAGVAA